MASNSSQCKTWCITTVSAILVVVSGRGNSDLACYFDDKLYDIINRNRYNSQGQNRYACMVCKSYDQLEGSYISLIDEEDFLRDPGKYVENAYEKSQQIENFNISKQG